MNPIFGFIKFIAYSAASVTVRKAWNWLTADVDPLPGTQEFDDEYRQIKARYKHLTKKKEEYNDENKKIR